MLIVLGLYVLLFSVMIRESKREKDMPSHVKRDEVRLSVALHEALEPPEGWADEDDKVQATNLWMDFTIPLSELRDVILSCDEQDSYEPVIQMIQDNFHDAGRYYRVWDNCGYEETECTEDMEELRGGMEKACAYREFHIVDLDSKHYEALFLGEGFCEGNVQPYARSLISEEG
jgi:hypothetical protein